MNKNYTNHRDILEEEFYKNLPSFYVNDSLNKTVKVLEIGAGATNAKDWFEDKYKNKQFFHAHKLDLEYTGIDNGSEYMQDGIIDCDAHDMKRFADESFDIVYLSHTAEHFIAPFVAFKEIFRVLKKGGMVLSITPNPCEHQILFGDGTHISVLNNLQWFRVLLSAGFNQDNITSYVQMTCKGKQIPVVQDYMVITKGVK